MKPSPNLVKALLGGAFLLLCLYVALQMREASLVRAAPTVLPDGLLTPTLTPDEYEAKREAAADNWLRNVHEWPVPATPSLEAPSPMTSPSSSQLDYEAYLPATPIMAVPQCLSYKATMWLDAPATVRPGQEFEVTAFLRSDDCSSFGGPMYSLYSKPGIWDSPPDRGASVEAGQTGSYTFTLTAPDEPQTVEVAVGAFFEVFYPPPPGSWSWGSSGTPWYTITVEEIQE